MCRTGMCLYGYGNWIFLIAVVNLFTLIQGAESDSGVQFSIEPQDAVVPPNAGVLLPCAATARDAPVTMSWRYRADDAPTRDHLLPANDHNRRQLTNGSLLIQSMSSSNAGHYQCVATAEGIGTIVSRKVLVSVAEAWLVEGVRTITSVADGVALLPCVIRVPVQAGLRIHNADMHGRRIVGGIKRAIVPVVNVTVSWSKNGVSLTSSSRTQLSSSGALEIDPLRTADAGNYICRLHVAGIPDRVGEPIELRVTNEMKEVETPPRFVATPRTANVIEGASITLDCAAVGNPKPKIIWLNKGVAIDLNDLDSRFSLVGSGSLLVWGARVQDAGAYTCRAANVMDAIDVSVDLHVASPPRVSLPSHAVTATERGDVTLRCNPKGRPAPVIVWLKDGEPITPNQHDMTLQHGRDLKIQGVLSVDAGMFQCSATSTAGSSLAALRLHVVPHDDESKTVAPLDTITSIHTNSHEIFSTLVSNPDPSFYPEFPDASPAFTPEPEILDSDYNLNSLENFHAAKGIVENPLGKSNDSVLLKPKGLKAVIVKHTFVTLSWDEVEDKNGLVKGYEVVYRVKGSQRERLSRSSTPRHEMNVASLYSNTTYEFWVRAYTDYFVSEDSEIIEATTLGQESEGATSISATANSPHSVTISWRAQTTPSSYTLYYAEVESGKEQYVSVPGTETATVVSGLRAAHTYRVRLEPGGQQIEVVTPSDVPAAPPANVTAVAESATSVRVSWEPPPPATHRGVLTGYKVRYRGGEGGAGGGALTTPADVRTVTVEGTGGNLQVRVCALNANGSGPFSEWVSIRSPIAEHADSQIGVDVHQVPPAPPPLKTRSGPDWISVQWSPSGPSPGPVETPEGWSLSWGLGVPDEHEVSLPASVTRRVITNLQSNSEYVLAVRGVSGAGPGPAVYATVRTGSVPGPDGADGADYDDIDPEDYDDDTPPPIPPVGLKVIMLSGTTAVVYWTDPTLPKGQTATDGRRYVVRYSTSGGRAKYFNATEINCMIYDLKPFTTYDFAVKLIMDGGRESTWSLLVSNTSLEAPPSSPPRGLQAVPSPRGLTLSWTEPAKPNGHITGYTIMYAAIPSTNPGPGSDSVPPPPGGAWSAVEVGGGRRSASLSLAPAQAYALKVQAYNSKGRGPFCQLVTAVTPNVVESTGTGAWLWASVGAAGVVVVGAGAAALSLCGARPPRPPHRDESPRRATKRDGLKPPDLWIHHDQMELKCVDKVSAGSIEGVHSVQTSTLTRAPPVDYEPARHPASLDRRYVPTYVASRAGSVSYGDSCSDETALVSCSRCDFLPMSGVGIGCSATCDRRLPMPRHPDQSTPLLSAVGGATVGGMSPHSSMASLQPSCIGGGPCPLGPACSVPTNLPTPGHDVYAVAARERGHYVAYEPLGGYTHRESLISELPALPPTSSLRRPPAPAPLPAPALHMSDASSTHSAHSTPSHDKAGSVRENSPYKKSTASSPGHHVRLHLGPGVTEMLPELEGLTPSRSSERLQREMDNLEGLMKDLSSITQQHYHC